ncbi:MAG: hypothetical protein M1813_003254 [Trichoglossum hirsutum]|nr:MAG: hypothetical protein M1813_003254 [Trichoglossum hirsutum]
MRSHSFVAVLAASALLTFSHLATASLDPVITPAPLFRDAVKVEKSVDREFGSPNHDLRARTPDEVLGIQALESRDFLTTCGYGYVDCGDGYCCSLGEVCYKSGTLTKCRLASYDDYGDNIDSILESLSAIISGLPTDFDNYLTNLPTNSAGLSSYIASLTSAELATFKTNSPTATKSTNANGNGNSRGSSGPAFQSDDSSKTEKKGLSTGAIGGIVAGIVLVIAVIAGALLFVLFRRKRRTQAAAAAVAPSQPQQPPQMAQPGYPSQSTVPQTPQTVYSQAAPPYPGIENGAFMQQQQQKTDTDYYSPPIPGAQVAQGDFKQQGAYVPPPTGQQELPGPAPGAMQGQQQPWHQHPPHQTSHELAINPMPVQQQWQPAQPPHSIPAGSGHNNFVYEMDTGLAR